jgi:hypothetical protein
MLTAKDRATTGKNRAMKAMGRLITVNGRE